LKRCDVLIVGAGPTGLALALWLAKLGVAVRIVDKTAGSGTASRALAVQARTLELYRQLDLTDAVLSRGHRVPAVNLWVAGERQARVAFETVGGDLTPYPFLHIFPQDEHERLLIERLRTVGVTVERSTELLGYSENTGGVVARLSGANRGEERCEASFIAGCDGARSLVRESMGTGFAGGTYRQVFYVADVEASGPALDGELHIDLDEADFLGLFPLAGSGRARLIGTVRDERADHADTMRFEDVSQRAITSLKVRVGQVNWFSTYHIHHRVAPHFRRGRALLLGDAAHIHSPVGGQGMNTGLGDAINLGWKLQAVLAGRAPETLLDSYEIERIHFARRLVATTDRAFTFVTADGRLADVVRTRVAPLVIPRIMGFQFAREFLFRTVSQITLNYRGSPLSRGAAGHVHGGDRLPWLRTGAGDNYDSLSAMVWQAHVYGSASAPSTGWCERHGIRVNTFEWQPQHGAAGLAPNALYLLRPDSYVALADATPAPEALERYFSDVGVRPGA
jgi:2-polyprenyl-6-methoxyphenol hydroxylase-like FAD-dependent oxidoreductase